MHIQRYLVTGLLTIIPLWITLFLFNFVFHLLSDVGLPWLALLEENLAERVTFLATHDLSLWVQRLIAMLLVLVVLYLLGGAMNRVLGQRLFGLFESVVHRVPLVEKVYGSIKKLVTVLQTKPDGVQRVVLIEFPSPGMKAVALVTRTLTDANTGETLVAVYVPTTPNPTSGYLEILPMDRITPTNWTMDEAMNFVISGGAVAPDTISFHGDSHGGNSYADKSQAGSQAPAAAQS